MNSEESKSEESPVVGHYAHHHEHEHGGRWCRRRLWFIPLIIGIVLVKAAVVMGLWNLLIPDLFHGPLLTYPQALGLMILAKLLVGFGGPFGGRGRFGGLGRHHHHGPWGAWAKMTDEERRKMREELRERWGR